MQKVVKSIKIHAMHREQHKLQTACTHDQPQHDKICAKFLNYKLLYFS